VVIATLHLVSTVAMAGIIVFVQIVHYPLMARVGTRTFIEYQKGHMSRTALVVIPLMSVELVTAVWLTAYPTETSETLLAAAGLLLLAIIWTSTAVLQAPQHGRLATAFDADVHRRLVRGNGVRTIAWLLRVPLAVVLAL
jgi:hypothetical protein